jgi:hypothetical protein
MQPVHSGTFMKRSWVRAAISGLLVPWMAYAGSLDLDALSDREGHIHPEHVLAAQGLLRDCERLEALYAEAMRSNPRASRAFHELETIYAPAIGQEVADRECLVPIKRELIPGCLPDWSFIDFLRSDRPGGARLRRVIADAYAARMRQRGLEARLIATSLNAILAVTVVGAVSQRAMVPGVAPATSSARMAPSGLGDLTVTEVEQIQSIVERAGRPLEVVDSAAKGARRGVGTDLPLGKGASTRSDIDYLAPPASASYFAGLSPQLPGLDADSFIVGAQNPFVGPAFRFEPGAPPRLMPGAQP